MAKEAPQNEKKLHKKKKKLDRGTKKRNILNSEFNNYKIKI
jgi:hypothetical protein